MPYNTPPANNFWYGNNYSSGYSQANRSNYSPVPAQNMPSFYPPMQAQQASPINNILQVMGPDSAEEFKVGPNSHVFLMDSNRPVFYIKRSDDTGHAETKAYEFHEIPMYQQSAQANTQQAPVSDYVTKADLEELKKAIEELVIGNA